MNIKELIDKNFGGNVSMFCRAFSISRNTIYSAMRNGYARKTALRRKLEAHGVKF